MTRTNLKISVVIITLNEAPNIENTLRAVNWCDEVIVIDSFSTDNTIEIAQKLGCKIFQRPFKGYGDQKNFGIQQAKNDWILSIDADEVLSAEISQEIQILLRTEPKEKGFFLPISLIFQGKILRFCGEYGMLHLRLFNRLFGQYDTNLVHEDVHIEGKKGKLKHHILHYSYQNMDDYFTKSNQYASLSAQMSVKNGKKNSVFKLIFTFPATFFKIYILKAGFLDGYQGFVWAMLTANYSFTKCVKNWELWDKTNIGKVMLNK
jgi:glycosyltransferase involved in cell wall biosynthesis